jgi:hypothetical protein
VTWWRKDGTAGRPAGDPFTVLGLNATPGLTDDDIRAAWRRVAAATHPDRADGGDPARFAEAAAAYTTLRTPSGRGEALADATTGPARRRGRAGARTTAAPARWARPAGMRATAAPDQQTPPAGMRATAAPDQQTPPAGALRVKNGISWLRAGAVMRLGTRIRRGRPGRLVLRVLATGVASAAAVAVAGSRPAGPALVTGAVTWLLLTARRDLAPPP